MKDIDRLKLVEESQYISEEIEIEDNLKIDISKYKYNMVDLFCGAGGFSIGGQMAGFFPVLGLDYLEPAMKTWKHNHPESIGILGDIKEINPNTIKKILENKGVNRINLLTGGVPCQGFSLANRKRNFNDERNFLFIEYMKFVKSLKPDVIILENVSGMKSTKNGEFVENILDNMDMLGYNATVELLNAAEYGVPQIRKRLIFVGINRSFKDLYFKFPDKYITSPDEYLTVEDAISDLPKLNNKQSKTKYEQSPITDYQRLMRGKCGLNIQNTNILYNHTAPNHTESTIKRIADTKQGQPMYDKFKQRIRLNSKLPSPTQLAGGIRPQFQFGHPTQNRGLTIRERARIQSFPDSYKFLGGMVQERVQTGNAVPPLLVYAITKEIYKILEEREGLNV